MKNTEHKGAQKGHKGHVHEGFFCQKCGTVYIPEIMACRTCQPKMYKKLADILEGK